MSEVQIIPLSNIQVPHVRQRTSIPDSHIQALRDSIEQNGLIHSLLVSEGDELIAGYCRLRAIQSLTKGYHYGKVLVAPDQVPVLRVRSLSDTEVFRLELEENLRRKNLTPAEEAVALSRLHRMLQDAAGEVVSYEDTAREAERLTGRTDIGRHEVSEAILISAFADDPDIQRATTKEEALKAARKKLEAQFSIALGGTITETDEDLELLEGNAIDIMPTFAEERFSCLIADPPYGMGADSFGDQTNILNHGYEDDPGIAWTLTQHILKEGFRVCNANAHLYLFCDIRRWSVLAELARSVGWQPFATPLIWDKGTAGHAPQPGFFLRRYETILFARKGNRALNRQISDVISIQSDKDKQHAAQKPVALYRLLMEVSMTKGEQVLDPCCGRGTVFLAAKAAHVRATGIEVHPDYINLARASAAPKGMV